MDLTNLTYAEAKLALSPGDRFVRRRVFRALIAWPLEGTLHGSSADDRRSLLVTLCEILIDADDGAPVPSDIEERIINEGGVTKDGSYSDCAAAVRRRLKPFFERLAEEPR